MEFSQFAEQFQDLQKSIVGPETDMFAKMATMNKFLAEYDLKILIDFDLNVFLIGSLSALEE